MMTQEEKARRYDEVLEQAKSWYTDAQIDFKKSLETLFPELKCDDEKIRKEIIKCVKNYGPSSANPQLFKNMLAWLEKQKTIDVLDKEEREFADNVDSYRKDMDEFYKKGYNAGREAEKQYWLEKQEGCECIKKDWLEHIKQSWYKEGFIDGKYSGGTSKEWTINDAAIFKEIIDFLENGTAKLQHDLIKYANWLKIQFTPIEKQGRQFSVDKLKPKFHEGEWITNGDYTWKVIKVEQFDYILQSQNDNVVDDTISHVDEQFHLWTIKDAKVGDVLAAHECVVLFKEIDGLNIKCYCTYHYIGFNPSFYVDTLQNKTAFQPATKELRDLLFQKMKEAGYEWDSEKKDLKKISQRMVSAEVKEALYDNPAWSEEDECYMAECINAIATKDGWSFEEKRKTKHWLKSIKERIGG